MLNYKAYIYILSVKVNDDLKNNIYVVNLQYQDFIDLVIHVDLFFSIKQAIFLDVYSICNKL